MFSFVFYSIIDLIQSVISNSEENLYFKAKYKNMKELIILGFIIVFFVVLKERKHNKMKKILYLLLCAALITGVLLGCSDNSKKNPAVNAGNDENEKLDESDIITDDIEPLELSIIYSNTDYGFDFALPASWQGYSTIEDIWSGQYYLGPDVGMSGETITGLKILIRHPLWTEENPYQDIPIMICDLSQGDDIEQEKLITSAGGKPTELARNSQYAFVLPARYNFNYYTDWEEVQKTINQSPLKATENTIKIPEKEGYSSIKLIDYSEKYDPYKDLSEYYKPCTFLNSYLNETIIEYEYNGNTVLIGKFDIGEVFMAVGKDKSNMDVFFWISDYMYPLDNIKIKEYKNVLGHDGIIFSFPEGADSSSIIYLYWENNSFYPIPLAVCNKSNYEIDINGDGINDIISCYNNTANIIYLYGNELYTADIGNVLCEVLNIDGMAGYYDVENNKFEFSDNTNAVNIECFIGNNILYYKQK